MAPSPRISLPLLVTVGAWGFNFTALKLLYREVPPPAVGLVRFLLMWAILALIVMWQKEALSYPKAKGIKILGIGFLSMGVYMVLFLEGLARTGASEGAIVLATAPIFTALIAAIFKQDPFRPQMLWGCLLAMGGVACVVSNGISFASNIDHSQHILGILLVLASAAVWALQAVHSRPLLSEMSSLRLLTLSMPGALVILVPYGLMASLAVPWTALSPITWLTLSHVTLLAGVAGFLGFYLGVRAIGAPSALLYQYFVPPIAVGCEAALLGKWPAPPQLLGLLFIISGVVLASRRPVAPVQPAEA